MIRNPPLNFPPVMASRRCSGWVKISSSKFRASCIHASLVAWHPRQLTPLHMFVIREACVCELAPSSSSSSVGRERIDRPGPYADRGRRRGYLTVEAVPGTVGGGGSGQVGGGVAGVPAGGVGGADVAAPAALLQGAAFEAGLEHVVGGGE